MSARKRRKHPKPTLAQAASPRLRAVGDFGPNTPLQRASTELEPVDRDNPNNLRRKRRIDWVARYSDGHGVVRAILDIRQAQAAKELQHAYEATQKSSAHTGERVDSSPKPDANIAVQVDAISRYAQARAAIPSAMAYVIDHVCEQNRPLTELSDDGRSHGANFKVALTLVANRLGY